jgi:ribosomal protein L28
VGVQFPQQRSAGREQEKRGKSEEEEEEEEKMRNAKKFSAAEARVFQRQHRALLGRRMRRSGNHVSYADNKTKRVWLPNVLRNKFFSSPLLFGDGGAQARETEEGAAAAESGNNNAAAGSRWRQRETRRGGREGMRLHVSAHALRSIERAGGLDNWLLFTRRDVRGHSLLADRLHDELRQAWEQKHGVVFDRRAILHYRKQGKDYVQEMLRRNNRANQRDDVEVELD